MKDKHKNWECEGRERERGGVHVLEHWEGGMEEGGGGGRVWKTDGHSVESFPFSILPSWLRHPSLDGHPEPYLIPFFLSPPKYLPPRPPLQLVSKTPPVDPGVAVTAHSLHLILVLLPLLFSFHPSPLRSLSHLPLRSNVLRKCLEHTQTSICPCHSAPYWHSNLTALKAQG